MKRLALTALLAPLFVHAACPQPYVFFDLGNTLVDTKTYNYKKMFYEPGAYDYVKALRAKGVHLGLLVNYPDSAGNTVEAKIADLKEFLQAGWWQPTPDAPKTFEWADYDQGIFVPPHNTDYKPAPFLFQQGLKIAQAAGCEAIYEGEDVEELKEAASLGFHARDVDKEGFVPVEELNSFVGH